MQTMKVLLLRKALLLSLTLGVGLGGSAFVIGVASAPAYAQLTVEPQTLSATVEQEGTITQTLTLTNTGSAALTFCISFDRPLQRAAGSTRISGSALGGTSGACGEYGEVLALVGREDVPTEVGWRPYGLTMTPDGRLFAADLSNGSFRRTVELTPGLDFVRHFQFPYEDELDFAPFTNGVTYNADTATLWWLNVEGSGFDLYRALLLEGDLDGVATGRRIELPIGAPEVPPDERVNPVGLSYDPARAWYYYTDIRGDVIWAVDTLGTPVGSYPVEMEGYLGATLGRGLNVLTDTSGGAEGAGLRFELYVNPPGPAPRRLGVVGRYGEDTAPGAEALETPLVESLPGTNDGDINGEAVRSVLDPNGVLYYPWSGFEDSGVVAIRPHPLPPSWLVVEAWDGTLGPGESTEIELTFRPGGRALGEYTAVLQAFEAESGAAVEVPLTLAVTQGTDAEDDAVAPEAPSLAVYPNPTSGQTTVALALDAAADVRVVVYDVIGRAVATLHNGELAAGRHEIALDGAALPAGLYLVRVAGSDIGLTRLMTVLR